MGASHRAELLSVLVAAFLAACAHAPPHDSTGRLNVVFIAVDDLRPELLSYGAPGMKTPATDALARHGVVFLRSYCQQALCNPSRASVLTGLRPDTIKVHSLTVNFRKARPDVVTLPEYFKLHGYHTQRIGKVFHSGLDDKQSWTEPAWFVDLPTYLDPADQRQVIVEPGAVRPASVDPKTGTLLETQIDYGKFHLGPPWEAPVAPDDAFSDGAIAVKASEMLKVRAMRKEPFFLAVGFSRPHLPLVAPRRFFDMYPAESISLAANSFPPANALDIALTDSEELRAYAGVPREGPLPPELARTLVRAYMASTSYVDAQIGRVVQAIQQNGLAGNTIIIVWGDHGFHLGEHGIWGKGTNFEVAARAPMIIAAPRGIKAGARVSALVEFVDIYPTLVELAGLPVPAALEGVSLVPLLIHPERKWKSAVFTQHPHGEAMGRSIRTERYRYTEWVTDGADPERELYDHWVDDAENENLAGRPGHELIIRDLAAQLHAGWRAALPPR